MNTQIVIRTLDALASGMDPVTGEVFPETSPYNQPVVLRSLFVALKVLRQPEGIQSAASSLPAEMPAMGGVSPGATAGAAPAAEPGKKAKAQKTPRVPPANAGKAWTPEEDAQLCEEFDGGIAVKDLAVKHSRSAAALNARLFKLGKIADPGFPLRMRPAA